MSLQGKAKQGDEGGLRQHKKMVLVKMPKGGGFEAREKKRCRGCRGVIRTSARSEPAWEVSEGGGKKGQKEKRAK